LDTPAAGKSDSQKRKPYRSVQLAKEYLLGYPAASNEDVVKKTGCSPRAVTRARQYLVTTGQLQKSYFDRQHRPAGPVDIDPDAPTGPSGADGPSQAGPLDPAALEKALKSDHGPALTLDQMRQRYSAIARYGQKMGEFTLEIQAMQALARLDATTGARDRLGPGIPLTRQAKVSRVSLIVEAAGPSIAAEAVIAVFEKPEFDRFVDELGRHLAKGRNDGVEITQYQPQHLGESPVGDQVPDAALSGPEISTHGGADRGKTIEGARSDGGTPLGGGTSGQEGG